MNETLIGVVFGGIITAFFTWFLEWRKDKRDQKRHLLRKKEEIYLEALNNIIQYLNYPFKIGARLPELSEEYNKKLKLIYASLAPMHLYASEAVSAKYMEMYVFLLKQENDGIKNPPLLKELVFLMKKEIGLDTQ